MHQVEHQPGLADDVGAVGDILRRRHVDARLGPSRPFFGTRQAALQFAHAAEILVELVAIGDAEPWLQRPGLIADRVQNAAAVAQVADLWLDLVGPAFDEESPKDAGRPAIRRHQGAGARPGETESLAGERKTRIARFTADVRGRELVERDAVAEAGADFRMG